MEFRFADFGELLPSMEYKWAAMVIVMNESDQLENTLRSVIRIIQSGRCDLSSEKNLQADLEALFIAKRLGFEREVRLSGTDIPDFVVDGGIVVECKIRNKGKKMAVYQQLLRYAEHPAVKAVILASNVSMTLPPELNGKPARQASLSRGWL